MPDRSGHAALALLDLTIGTAAAGMGGLARAAGVAARLAAPPARLVAAAGWTAARRVPGAPAERLRATGRRLRADAGTAAANRLQPLLPLVLDAVLDQVDLTELVVRRVDLDRVARHIDVDAVAGRLDLIGFAQYIVDGIDLPKIIRESTGSVASEGIRGMRMQGIEADEALAGFVDRVLLRRRPRRTGGEHRPEGRAGRSLADGAGP